MWFVPDEQFDVVGSGETAERALTVLRDALQQIRRYADVKSVPLRCDAMR